MGPHQKRRKAVIYPRDPVEPSPPPVCKQFIRCKACPYATNGFICFHDAGHCIRTDIARIYGFELRNKYQESLALCEMSMSWKGENDAKLG